MKMMNYLYKELTNWQGGEKNNILAKIEKIIEKCQTGEERKKKKIMTERSEKFKISWREKNKNKEGEDDPLI